jgi:hypothetical protein
MTIIPRKISNHWRAKQNWNMKRSAAMRQLLQPIYAESQAAPVAVQSLPPRTIWWAIG